VVCQVGWQSTTTGTANVIVNDSMSSDLLVPVPVPGTIFERNIKYDNLHEMNQTKFILRNPTTKSTAYAGTTDFYFRELGTSQRRDLLVHTFEIPLGEQPFSFKST
jgi:hypothetical protein